jgi:hypothetical protein
VTICSPFGEPKSNIFFKENCSRGDNSGNIASGIMTIITYDVVDIQSLIKYYRSFSKKYFYTLTWGKFSTYFEYQAKN